MRDLMIDPLIRCSPIPPFHPVLQCYIMQTLAAILTASQSACLKRTPYAWGQLGVEMVRRFHMPVLAAKVLIGYACVMSHWIEPPEETLAIGEEGYRAGREVGEQLFLPYWLFGRLSSSHNFCSLTAMQREIEHAMKRDGWAQQDKCQSITLP